MPSKVIFNENFEKKILKIELNNLSKNNALSLEMLSSITKKLSHNNVVNNFKCIVISGIGESPYSSGADLDDINKLIIKKNMNFYHQEMNKLLIVISKLKIPVVSIIRTYCFGAGLILALNSDIIIAGESTIFCIPASKLKIKIPKKQIFSLKKKINQKFLKDIILTSRKFSASEAFSKHVVNFCIKDKELKKFSENYISQIINKDRKINTFYLDLLRN